MNDLNWDQFAWPQESLPVRKVRVRRKLTQSQKAWRAMVALRKLRYASTQPGSSATTRSAGSASKRGGR